MKKASLILTILVLASLLLAACGAEEATSVPNTSAPPPTVEATSTSERTATEAATSTLEANTEATAGIPVTGGGKPSRSVTSLIGSPVCGLAGDQLGTVSDLVLDFNQMGVTYLIVDANGKAVPVPYSFLAKPRSSGTGTGTGSGAGSTQATETPLAGGTGDTSTQATSTPAAGAQVTDTPSTGGAASTATSTTGTGTGNAVTGATGQQNCLTLTAGNDVFNSVPAFDPAIMPGLGQSAQDWDTTIMPYWVGGVEDIATNTPEPTSTPSSTGTTGTSTPSVNGVATATATTSAGGSGSSADQGASAISGVALATDLIGTSFVLNSQGTGTGSDTGTVQDVIIEPRIGKLQYVVVSLASGDTWTPIPIRALGWEFNQQPACSHGGCRHAAECTWLFWRTDP